MKIKWWHHAIRWAIWLACMAGAAGLIMKVTGCVDWSWWKVLSPFGFSLILIVAMVVGDCIPATVEPGYIDDWAIEDIEEIGDDNE